jgi:hypothetical protein
MTERGARMLRPVVTRVYIHDCERGRLEPLRAYHRLIAGIMDYPHNGSSREPPARTTHAGIMRASPKQT